MLGMEGGETGRICLRSRDSGEGSTVREYGQCIVTVPKTKQSTGQRFTMTGVQGGLTSGA